MSNVRVSNSPPDPETETSQQQSAAKMTTQNGLRKSGIAKQPLKKLIIKNFKVKPTLPENFEEETWQKLRAAIHAIHGKQPVATSLEELYKAVENLCDHKMSDSLYRKLEHEIDEHTTSEQQTILSSPATDTVGFLLLVNNVWKDFCEQLLLIRGIFLYLDRKYALNNSVTSSGTIKSIWDLGLYLFRENIVLHPEIEKKLLAGLLTLIERERTGETVDRTLLNSLLRMYTALQIYTDHFERQFLDMTTEFYKNESFKLIHEFDIAEYLRHVERRIDEENERVVHYLDPKTRKPLIACVDKTLLEAHVDTILGKGFDVLMDENRVADVKRMYHLLMRVNAQKNMKIAWNQYIKKRGVALVTDEQKDKTMIQELLNYKARLDHMLEEAFNKNDEFAYALKEAFEYFVNVRQNVPAELLAKFIHYKLRTGKNKALSDEELESLLDKVMQIFRYINGKDVFEAFYRKDLAKRLLLGKSVSIDAEKLMISKLKAECGAGYTSKLEGMFKDIELSKDFMALFNQSKDAALFKGVDPTVYILTTGYWPTYTPIDVKLPQQLMDFQEIIRKFYCSKYSGRRLHWQNSLGHCTLRAWFPKGRKELSVSLFQTVVLLLFNDSDHYTYEQLKEATGLEENELKRTLTSLSLGKARVLTKEPKNTKDIALTDTFSYNKGFTAKLYRIKINAVQLKETKEEQKKTQEGVFQDRQYQVDAAIVRIMKTRKTLTHSQLISELYQQLKFPVKPVDLKKRIESLIEREYLERSPDDPNTYNYLA